MLIIPVFLSIPLPISAANPAKNLLARAVGSTGYPPCAQDLCLLPLAAANICDQSKNACCLSRPWYLTWASCLGTLCPADLADVYATASSRCTSTNDPIAITLEDWISAAKVPWHFAVGGVFTTAPPSPTPLFDPALFQPHYPPCVFTMCIPMYLYYPLICPLALQATACPCLNAGALTLGAACVGKFCPADVAGMYSTTRDICSNGGFSIALSLEEWVGASHQDPLVAYERGKSAVAAERTSASVVYVPVSSTRLTATASSAITSVLPVSRSTSRTGPSTATSTASSPPADTAGSGLSRSDKIALGVGLSVGLPAVIIGLVQACLMCARPRV